MKITIATKGDVQDIMKLIGFCIKDLKNQGIYQWNDHYPTLDHIKESIQIQSLYILKNKDPSNTLCVFGAPKIYDFRACMGIISIGEQQPEGYEEINWSNKTGKVLVISKLAVNPKCQGHGIGQKLMDFAENYAIEKEYNSIRLDAYSDNPRALKFYRKRNYKKVGEQYFPRRDLPFYCFEKLIN